MSLVWMRFLLEPRFFSFLIMTLYVTNAVNFAIRREWAQMSYWLGAFWITASVTFGMTH